MTATAQSGRRPDEVPTRVFDWGTIKWLVTPHLDGPIGLDDRRGDHLPRQGTRPAHPSWRGGDDLRRFGAEGVQTVGDGPAFPIREGDALYVPRDTLHSTYNTTWRPLRLVVVYTPGGAETGLDALPDARILEPGVMPTWSQDRG